MKIDYFIKFKEFKSVGFDGDVRGVDNYVFTLNC